MKFFTVHEPPDAAADRIDRAESLAFIRDGFNSQAFVFGPLWLIANRLWLAVLGYIAIAAALSTVVLGFGLDPRWLSLLYSALNLIVGFEAASLRRWGLERRGWQMLGTVSGRTLDECERRFLEGWLNGPRLSRADEFVATVNALRGSGGSGGLAAMAADGVSSGGRLSRGLARDLRPGVGRNWLPWRRDR